MDKDSDEVKYFLPLTLLFGEVAAVYGFNRPSKLFEKIATRLCLLVCTSYFDDYCQVEAARLAESAEFTLKYLFNVLGVDIALTEKKDKPFARTSVGPPKESSESCPRSPE